MWSFIEEFQKLTEKYRQFGVYMSGVAPGVGVPSACHYESWFHTDYCQELSELLEKDRWSQQAKQQEFVQKCRKDIREQMPKDSEEGLVALTVRPEDGKLETCKEIIARIKKISAVLRMVYVFEQKAEDPAGEPHGWHIHASIKTTYKPSHIKTYVGQVTYKKKKDTIVCSVHTTKADYRWEANYMKGDKHMESKEAACKCDIVFREKLGLEPYYVYEKSS